MDDQRVSEQERCIEERLIITFLEIVETSQVKRCYERIVVVLCNKAHKPDNLRVGLDTLKQHDEIPIQIINTYSFSLDTSATRVLVLESVDSSKSAR